jgi:hypothetical protein
MFCLMKTLEYTLNKGIFTLVGTTFNLLGKIFNVVVKRRIHIIYLFDQFILQSHVLYSLR